MHISYAEFQALLDRIAGLEKRVAQTEKDLLANEKEFELIVQVKEDMYDRIVGLENKVFPRLGEALRQVTLYYRGKPTLAEILAELATWASRL